MGISFRIPCVCLRLRVVYRVLEKKERRVKKNRRRGEDFETKQRMTAVWRIEFHLACGCVCQERGERGSQEQDETNQKLRETLEEETKEKNNQAAAQTARQIIGKMRSEWKEEAEGRPESLSGRLYTSDLLFSPWGEGEASGKKWGSTGSDSMRCTDTPDN